MLRAAFAAALAAAAFAGGAAAGERQYLYVWTAGVDGQSDGSDKLVTVDATRRSDRHGKVVHTLSVGGRAELAALALSADARTLRAVRTDGKAFEFDLVDPSRPRLRRATNGATGGEVPREAQDAQRRFVAGVPARDERDAAYFVRAFNRGDETSTISFEIDFRAPRLGLPRALVLLDR